MSELKVNTISEVTGANGVVVDSVKLKDGGVIIADAGNIGSASDTDAIAIASNGAVTFSQAASFSSTIASTGAITSNAGVVVDNITIDGTEIDLSSGDLTLDVAGDITLDADGGDINFLDGGTTIAVLTNSSTDFVIKSVTNDKDLIFKGVDNSSVITALTLDMSDAGTAVFNHDIRVADGGQIGSASDADAMTIASGGAVTFTQAPVFPDGSIAVADLDIDGATDIGADIVDADLFIVDDGAGGTNRKMAASRLKTYVGTAGRATLIDTITLSSSSTAVFDSSDITGYDNYLITVENVITGSGNIHLEMHASTDNGSSYETSSGDYRKISFNGIENESNNGFTSRYGTNENDIRITGNYANNGNDAALKIDATCLCFTLNSSSYKKFLVHSAFGDASDPPKLVYENALHLFDDSQSAVNNLKIQASSGTLTSGKIKLFGLA